MKLNCHFCKEELVEKGALIFSPPYRIRHEYLGKDYDVVNKFHVCEPCFLEVMADWKPTPFRRGKTDNKK